MSKHIMVTTGDNIDGALVEEYLGIVRGIAVRVPTLSQGFQALGSALSGNFQAGAEMYAEVCETARDDAYRRMVKHARDLEADAIIAMRYNATDVGDKATEILAYGTAVRLKYPQVTPLADAQAKQ